MQIFGFDSCYRTKYVFFGERIDFKLLIVSFENAVWKTDCYDTVLQTKQ